MENKPDIYFIGLGTFKAATTFIAMILKNHPETCLAIGKEVHYFNKYFGIQKVNDNFNKPISWYSEHFVHCENDLKKGEFSPMYLFDPYAPEAIYRLYPNVKLIICLRHPVERAFSHFIMEKYTQKQTQKYNDCFSDVVLNKAFHMQAGLYHEQIGRYLKYFDISQMHFIFTEELKEDKNKELKKLFKFLELKNIDIDISVEDHKNNFKRVRFMSVEKFFMVFIVFSRWLMKHKLTKENHIAYLYNTTFVKRLRESNFDSSKYPTMQFEIRKKALEYFREDTERLEKLLNKDLSHWKI